MTLSFKRAKVFPYGDPQKRVIDAMPSITLLKRKEIRRFPATLPLGRVMS